MSSFERDLSKGNVARQLLSFALPFIASNLVQSLYNIADMVIVGKFSGDAMINGVAVGTISMSGVNLGGQVTMAVTNAVIGLCTGGTVLIAQYLGAGKRKELGETVSTLFTFLVMASAALTVGMLTLSGPMLRLIGAPPESMGEAGNYLRITALGTLFIFGYNALSAVMRGMGDSRRPMLYVTIACMTNIVLDLLFVAVFHMRAAGAAIATVISQALSMILCIRHMRKSGFVFDFRLKSFGINGVRMRKIFQIGIPTSVQNMVSSVSFLFITSLVNQMGVTASAAVGAVGKFNSFALLPAIAISSSISAMSAQNIGAGEHGRALKTMQYGLMMSSGIAVVIFAVSQLFPRQILSVFTSDAAVFEAGITYLRTFSFDYLIAPIFFAFNGLIIGSGHTRLSLINTMLSSVLFRAPMAYIFGITLEMGLRGVGMGAPIASLASATIALGFILTGRWKHKRLVDDDTQVALET